MKREQWEPKHTLNLVLIVSAILAVVVLAVWADGAYVREVLAFAAGLLIPGSPVPAFVGSKKD